VKFFVGLSDEARAAWLQIEALGSSVEIEKLKQDIARTILDAQCLTESPWSVAAVRQRRLKLILEQLNGRAITLVIDETGDRKKGNTTDYVARQYIGNIGKIENGIVSVNAYGIVEQLTFQEPVLEKFRAHICWQSSSSWTSRFHNLQLIIQPYVYFCLLQPWLSVFAVPSLERGFAYLIRLLNQFSGWQLRRSLSRSFGFSSA
jgi:hypothetical protein